MLSTYLDHNYLMSKDLVGQDLLEQHPWLFFQLPAYSSAHLHCQEVTLKSNFSSQNLFDEIAECV